MDEYLTLRWSTPANRKKEATHYTSITMQLLRWYTIFRIRVQSWYIQILKIIGEIHQLDSCGVQDQPHVLARLACSIVLPTGIWNQFGEPRICGMDWSRRFGGSWVTLGIKSDCFLKVLVFSCLVIHEFGIVWFSDVSLCFYWCDP